MTKTLPKIALGAWAWGNDGTFYPYSYPTEKQISAMDEVKLSHVDVTIYEMTYQFLKLVL